MSFSFFLLLVSLIVTINCHELTNTLFTKAGDKILVKEILHIGLIGFDDMVTEEELLDMLSHTMSDYTPTLFHSNKENMNFFNYSIEYDIRLFSKNEGDELWILMKSLLNPSSDFSDYASINYNDPMFESQLNILYNNHFQPTGSYHKQNEIDIPTFGILFINPDLEQIKPEWYEEQIKPFHYLYKSTEGYNNTGTFTWLSKLGYIVIDIKAGPLHWGNMKDNDYIHSDLYTKYKPGIDTHGDHILYKNPSLLSKICVLTVNSIEFLFASDIPYDTINNNHVIIPIVIFYNHNDFNPIGNEKENLIDFTFIENEIKKILLPHQILHIVPMLLPIQYNTHIALALSNGLKTKMSYIKIGENHYHPSINYYLEPTVLYESIKNEGNELIIDYLNSINEYSEIINTTKIRPIESSIIPVYVFSLNSSSYDENITFANKYDNNNHLYYEPFSDGVLVLQTINTNKETDFYTNKKQIKCSGLLTTNYIIAGLLQTVGNINVPFVRYSEPHQKYEYSYLFVYGYHPFSLINKCSSLSNVYYSISQRNNILAEVADAIIEMRNSLEKINDFAFENFLITPFYSSATHEEDNKQIWIDILYHNDPNNNDNSDIHLLTYTSLSKLHSMMLEIEKDYQYISREFNNANFRKAYDFSLMFLDHIHTFTVTVNEELYQMRENMNCCFVKHEIESVVNSSVFLKIFGVFVFIFVIGFVVTLIVRKPF